MFCQMLRLFASGFIPGLRGPEQRASLMRHGAPDDAQSETQMRIFAWHLVQPTNVAAGRLGGQMFRVGGRSDRQNVADRLDPMCTTMVTDELDHHFDRQSSSHCPAAVSRSCAASYGL